MKTSQRLIQLLNTFEDCKLVAYRDIGGVLTIGWGTTRYPDTGVLVQEHETCTRAQADAWRDADIAEHATGVNDALYRVIEDWDADPAAHQDMFDALVDFSYNAGVSSLRGSTLRLRVEQGRRADAAEEFKKWTLADGKRSNGLLRRRLAERALFLGDLKTDGSLRTEKSDFPDAQWYPAA